jgi:hypothetical protein
VDADRKPTKTKIVAMTLATAATRFRWPKLTVGWRRYTQTVTSEDSVIVARFVIVNVGGSTADAWVVVDLDGKPLLGKAASIAPNQAMCWAVPLLRSDQADELADWTLDLHGRRLKACASYRRASFLPTERTYAAYSR